MKDCTIIYNFKNSTKMIIVQGKSHIITDILLRIWFTSWNVLSLSKSQYNSPIDDYHDRM